MNKRVVDVPSDHSISLNMMSTITSSLPDCGANRFLQLHFGGKKITNSNIRFVFFFALLLLQAHISDILNISSMSYMNVIGVDVNLNTMSAITMCYNQMPSNCFKLAASTVISWQSKLTLNQIDNTAHPATNVNRLYYHHHSKTIQTNFDD